MLSDEEKKAMDSLKVISEYAGDNYLAKEHRRKLKMLIELVEKQSKEIEEYKKQLDLDYVRNNYINKDKIKAKIEEIEQYDKKYKNYLKDGRENFTPEYVWARPVLQALLEEE